MIVFVETCIRKIDDHATSLVHDAHLRTYTFPPPIVHGTMHASQVFCNKRDEIDILVSRLTEAPKILQL